MPVTISQLTVRVGIEQAAFDKAVPNIDAKLTALANKGVELGAKVTTAVASIGEASEVSSAQVQALSRQLAGVSAQVEETFGKMFGGLDAQAKAAFASVSDNAERSFETLGSAADKATLSIAGITESAEAAAAAVAAVGMEGEAGLTRLSGAAQGVSAVLGGLGDVAAGITAIAGASAIMGSSFEASMLKIRNNTTMADSDFKLMKASVLSLSASSGTPLQELGNAFLHISAYGYQGADAVRILSEANKSAVATGTSVEDTANSLSTALHEFAMKSTEAGGAMNVLHLAAASGNMTLRDFTAASGRTLATAATMGVKLTDVSAAFAAMTRHGYDAHQAATQITDAMLHIANPTAQARKAIKALSDHTGVDLVRDFSQAGLASKGLIGVLQDVKRATGGNAEAVNALIGAMRGGQGALILTNQGNRDYLQILNQLNAAMKGKVDPTTRGFNAVMATSSQRFKVMAATLKTELIPMGNEFANVFMSAEPAILALMRAVEGVMALFAKMPVPVQQAVLGLGAFVLVTKALGNPLMGLTAGVAGLIKTLTGEGLAGALEGLGGASVAAEGGLAAVAAAAWPITLAVAAVAAVVAGLAIAWKNDFGHIREHTAAVAAWVEGRLTEFGAYISKEMGRATAAVVSYWNEIAPEVKQVVSFIAGYVETEFTGLSLYLHTWGKVLLGILSAAWDLIKGVIRLAVTEIAGHIKIALDLMTGHWGKAWADWKSMTQSEGGILKDTFGNVFTDLETGFTNSLTSMADAWTAFWAKLRSGAGLGDALKAANDAAQSQGQAQGQPPIPAGGRVVNIDTAWRHAGIDAAGPMGARIANDALTLQTDHAAQTYVHHCQALARTTVQESTHIFDGLFAGSAKATAERMKARGLVEPLTPQTKLKPGDLLYSTSMGGKDGHVQTVGPNGDRLDQYGSNHFGLNNFQYVFDPDKAAKAIGRTSPSAASVRTSAASGGVTGANITAWEKQAQAEAKAAKKAAADAQREIDERAKHLAGTVADLNKDFVKLSAVPTLFGKKVADDSKQADVALQLTTGDLKGVTAAQAAHVLSLARTVDALKMGHDALVSNAEALAGLRKEAALGADATDVQKLKFDQARQAAELNSISLRGLTTEQRRHIQAQREAVAVQQAVILHLTELTRLEKLVHPLQEATVLAGQPQQKQETIQAAEQYRKTLASLHEQMALVDDGVKREAISTQGGEEAWKRLTAAQQANLLGQTGLRMAMESLSGTAHDFANKVKDAGQGVNNETTAAAKSIDKLLATDGVAASDPKVAGFIRKIMDAAKSLDLTSARKGIQAMTDALSEGAAKAQAKIAGTFDERADALRQYLKQNADAIKQMQAAASQAGQSFDAGAMSDQFLKNYDLGKQAEQLQAYNDRLKETAQTLAVMRASSPEKAFAARNPELTPKQAQTLYGKQEAVRTAQTTAEGVFKVIQDSWDSSFGQGFKNLGHTFMSFFKGVEQGFQSLLKKMAYDIINSAMQQELARVMSGIFDKDKKDGKPGGLEIPKPTPKDTEGKDAAAQAGVMGTVIGSVLGGGGVVGAIGAMIGSGMGGEKPPVPASANPAAQAATAFQTSSTMLLTAGFQPLGLVLQQLIATMGQLITAESMAATTAGGGTLTAGMGGAGGFAGPLTSILGAVSGGGGGNSLDSLLGPLSGILGAVTGGGGGNLGGAMSILSPLENLGFSGLATGGTAYSDKPYVVGEHGPELFTPTQTGSIAPNGSGGSGGGGGMVLHQHFIINTPNAQSFGASQSQILEKGFNAARKAAGRDGRN